MRGGDTQGGPYVPGGGPTRTGERFVFGIPLISRAAARDWGLVARLLELTLRSVLAQSDPRFEVCLAAHDVPECWRRLVGGDPRFRVLRADWSPDAPTSANDDGGAKKWRIKDHVRETGGGLLMYLDADDLVDRGTVALSRARIGPAHVGGVVGQGVALDLPTLRAARLPDPRLYDGPFHELCGSSTVGRIEPGGTAWVRRDPHEALGSHHRWPEAAARLGVPLARLPATGAYLVNTSQNHSETHGPYAAWRRELNRRIPEVGEPIGEALSRRLGLDLAMLQSASREARGARGDAEGAA